MTSSLEEAASRGRVGMAYIDDVFALCDAMIAELDETPVTEEFAKSIGCVLDDSMGQDIWRFHQMTGDGNACFSLRFSRSSSMCNCSLDIGSSWIVYPTVGQLRTLCRALGIVLDEGK